MEAPTSRPPRPANGAEVRLTKLLRQYGDACSGLRELGQRSTRPAPSAGRVAEQLEHVERTRWDDDWLGQSQRWRTRVDARDDGDYDPKSFAAFVDMKFVDGSQSVEPVHAVKLSSPGELAAVYTLWVASEEGSSVWPAASPLNVTVANDGSLRVAREEGWRAKGRVGDVLKLVTARRLAFCEAPVVESYESYDVEILKLESPARFRCADELSKTAACYGALASLLAAAAQIDTLAPLRQKMLQRLETLQNGADEFWASAAAESPELATTLATALAPFVPSATAGLPRRAASLSRRFAARDAQTELAAEFWQWAQRAGNTEIGSFMTAGGFAHSVHFLLHPAASERQRRLRAKLLLRDERGLSASAAVAMKTLPLEPQKTQVRVDEAAWELSDAEAEELAPDVAQLLDKAWTSYAAAVAAPDNARLRAAYAPLRAALEFEDRACLALAPPVLAA